MSKVVFYHGTMRSGKTAHLIMQIYNLHNKGVDVTILKPSRDTRNHGVLKSRALETTYEAQTFDCLESLNNILANNTSRFIFIDESQFIDKDSIERIVEYVHENNVTAFFYGLKNSFAGRLFEGTKTILEYADSIRELDSLCDFCDNKATTHLKKVGGKYIFEGSEIAVGDIEYFSVCVKCFLENKSKINN